MLSLYDTISRTTNSKAVGPPFIDRALVQASILHLHQWAGLQLFDVGTTAGYFEKLYGAFINDP